MRLEGSNHVQSYYQLRPRTDVSEDVQPDASDAGRLIDRLIATGGSVGNVDEA
jgi:hypothetical protein